MGTLWSNNVYRDVGDVDRNNSHCSRYWRSVDFFFDFTVLLQEIAVYISAINSDCVFTYSGS